MDALLTCTGATRSGPNINRQVSFVEKAMKDLHYNVDMSKSAACLMRFRV